MLGVMRSFCTECKCMQSESIGHCRGCNVCVEGSWAHVGITNTCVTSKNWKQFVLFCGSMVAETVVCVI
jgi:hypothetical protein